MIPHPHNEHLAPLQELYNKKGKTGRSVVEHAFDMKSFRELLQKFELRVNHLVDVVTACCLLHNLILEGRDVDVEYLLEVLAKEARADIAHGRQERRPRGKRKDEQEDPSIDENLHGINLQAGERSGFENRAALQLYLGQQNTTELVFQPCSYIFPRMLNCIMN